MEVKYMSTREEIVSGFYNENREEESLTKRLGCESSTYEKVLDF